jgi:hypothetical protein
MYAFWTLISLIVVAIVAYAYLVNAAIFHTAQRQQIEDTIVDTKSIVSHLVFVERDSTVSLSLHEIER